MINPTYMLFPKAKEGSIKLLAVFNKGLAKLKENGKIEQYINDAREGAYRK